MSLYLGLDSSTQSLSAIVLEVDGDRRRVVFESSIAFDETFPQYGTEHGVLPSDDPTTAVSPPLLWVEALELMMRAAAEERSRSRQLAAISGSAQQHGSVYLNAPRDARRSAALDPARPLAEQVKPMLSRDVAPIWMDSSTSAECARNRGGGRRRSDARAAHRVARVRALHRGADSKVLQARTRGVRRDRSHPPRQLVSRVAPDRRVMRRWIRATDPA